MSHELRTPLNAILGFGQLMELDAVSPHHRENADQILKAGRHLLTLINEVLDITGIESGRLNISAEPVRVGDVMEEVVDLVAPLAAAGGIELRVDAEGIVDRYVVADRQRLKQVLLNLVANAIKYNRSGGYVRVGGTSPQPDTLRLIVEDSGPGIDAKKVERLFTPFDRLGAEQTGVEGTGLGLALSKRLAEAMGGTIGCTSVVGAGSTFWIELPCTESPLARLARLEPNAVASVARATNVANARIVLYVEDNLSNLTLVQRILEPRTDIKLVPAMQGALALELARAQRPDLVLLDLHLPDINGEEVLRQLRLVPGCRDVPVMILSADATRSQADRLLAAGADAYMTKPLDVKPFIQMLDEMLDKRRAA
jgi:CheY-like chemotaxis protein